MPASDNIISFHLFKLFTANPWFLNVFLRTTETEQKAESCSWESIKTQRNTTTPAGAVVCSSDGKTFSDNKKLVFFFHNSLGPLFNFSLSALWKYWRSVFCFYIYISVTFQFLVLHEISIGWKVSSSFWHTFSRIKVLCACTESLTSMVETRKKRRKRPKTRVAVGSPPSASRLPVLQIITLSLSFIISLSPLSINNHNRSWKEAARGRYWRMAWHMWVTL